MKSLSCVFKNDLNSLNSFFRKIVFCICFFSASLFAEEWNVDATGNWSTATNWNLMTVPNNPSATATFGSIIAAPRTVTVNGTFSVGTLNIDNANAYNLSLVTSSNITQNSTNIFSISGAITGSGVLEKSGPETLFLTGNNTYTGGTTVSAGTLQGSNNGIQGNIINNATVFFTNLTLNAVYSGVMSGTGSLAK